MSDTPDDDDTGLGISAELVEQFRTGKIGAAELLQSSPKLQYEFANLGYQMFSSGKLANALTVYRGLVAVAPQDSTFHCHLGATLYALGNLEEAFGEYTRALELDPDDVDARVGRGELHLRANRLQPGVDDLQKAVELDPDVKHRSTARAGAVLAHLERRAGRAKAAPRSTGQGSAGKAPAKKPGKAASSSKKQPARKKPASKKPARKK